MLRHQDLIVVTTKMATASGMTLELYKPRSLESGRGETSRSSWRAAWQPRAQPSPRHHHLLGSHANRANVGENQPPTDVSIDHRRHLSAPCSVATPSSLRSPFRPSAGLCAFPRTNRLALLFKENTIHTIRRLVFQRISSPNFF